MSRGFDYRAGGTGIEKGLEPPADPEYPRTAYVPFWV